MKIKFELILLVFLFLGIVHAHAQTDAVALSDSLRLVITRICDKKQTSAYEGIFVLIHDQHPQKAVRCKVWFRPPYFYRLQFQLPHRQQKIDALLRDGKGWIRTANGWRPRPLPHFMKMATLQPKFEARYLQLIMQNYQLTLRPGEILIGRPTLFLEIKPKYPQRFGLRFWIDREKWVVLKRQRFIVQNHSEKSIMEQYFEQITFHSSLPDSLFDLSEVKEMASVKKPFRARIDEKRFRTIEQAQEAVNFPIYSPQPLMQGFHLMSVRIVKEHHRQIVHTHYSDGLMNFSIFQFRGKPPRRWQRFSNLSEVPSNLPSCRRRQFIFVNHKDEFTFILVGNLPRRWLEKIFAQLQPSLL